MRWTLLVLSLGGLAACGGSGEPRLVGNADPQLRFGGGYRSAEDPCKRVGQTPFVERFFRADEDLVGCPLDFDGRAAFIQGTSAREVTRTGEWVIYTVPLFGSAPVSNIPAAPPITGSSDGTALTGPNAAGTG